jgi:hypothetical protein
MFDLPGVIRGREMMPMGRRRVQRVRIVTRSMSIACRWFRVLTDTCH